MLMHDKDDSIDDVPLPSTFLVILYILMTGLTGPTDRD